jgi:CubicO group peptidase (beta-lactamase class C family)
LQEHTTGLYDITADEFNHDTEKPISLEQAFLISPKKGVTNWAPGTHNSYSILGVPMVALLIEQTSGITFEDFVDTYILEPLGMYRSTFWFSFTCHLDTPDRLLSTNKSIRQPIADSL